MDSSSIVKYSNAGALNGSQKAFSPVAQPELGELVQYNKLYRIDITIYRPKGGASAYLHARELLEEREGRREG